MTPSPGDVSADHDGRGPQRIGTLNQSALRHFFDEGINFSVTKSPVVCSGFGFLAYQTPFIQQFVCIAAKRPPQTSAKEPP